MRSVNDEVKKAFPDIKDGNVADMFKKHKDILGIKIDYNEGFCWYVSRYSIDKFYSLSSSETHDGVAFVNEEVYATALISEETGKMMWATKSMSVDLDSVVVDGKSATVQFLKKADCTAEELYLIYDAGGEIEIFSDTDDFQWFYGLKNQFTETDGPRFLDDEKMSVKVGHLHEELAELEEAWKNGDLAEAADALIDLVYVANGTMNLCNLPASVLWRDVQNSNMIGKERVKSLDNATKRGSTFDVKQTKDWVGPRGSELIEVYRRWCNK